MVNLMQGDCLELMKNIPDGSVDLILTDPPYGTTSCKWDSIIPFEPMWAELKRIIKPNGAIVLFGSEPFSSALRMSNIKQYKYDWYWNKSVKTGHLIAKHQPMRCVELISVFYSKKPNYNPQMISLTDEQLKIKISKKVKTSRDLHKEDSVYSQKMVYGRDKIDMDSFRFNYPNHILNFNAGNSECNKRNRVHPTQKPVALLEYLIKTYTNEGETVLDFTMGSGSTGVAAKNLRRGFIGIEMDEAYFNIAKNRIESV